MDSPHSNLSPDEEYEVARKALAAGDLSHAAHHLGGALVADHENERYLKLADAIARKGPDDLALLFPEREDGLYFGAGALKAWILAARWNSTGALDTLLQVAAVDPAGHWMSWAARWMLDDRFARECDPVRVAAALLSVEKRVDFAKHTGLLDEVTSFADHLAGLKGSGELALAALRLLRENGQAQRAVDLTLRAEAVGHTYMTAAAVAGAMKAAGRLQEALEWFRTASERAPEDQACRMDAADILADLGRNEEALATYEDTLTRVPDHPWALPSALYGRAVSRQDPAAAKALDALARAEPPNERARQLAESLRASGLRPPEGEAYVDYLPRRTEAVLDALRQLLARQSDPHGPGSIRLTLDAMEAPSALAAMKLQFHTLGWPFDLNLTVNPLQQPDPRLPRPRGWLRRRPKLVLWEYEGVLPRPAVPPPPAVVIDAVTSLAKLPFSLDRWWQEARTTAVRLADVPVEQVAAALAHPAQPTPDADSGDWVFAQQVAAALVLAQGPEGLDLLEDVLHGPMDWTCGAAALALARACPREPGPRARRYENLLRLLRAPPSHGGWCLEGPLAAAARLVCDDAELQEQLARIARR